MKVPAGHLVFSERIDRIGQRSRADARHIADEAHEYITIIQAPSFVGLP